MQSFRVTVNGKAYEVTVEDITQTQGVAGVAPQEAAAAEKVVGTAALDAPAAPTQSGVAVSVGAGETPVNAPLSGSILAVRVKPGETVKYGQVLLTLEALKMENEIVAPEAGTVKAIFVKEGARVNLGDVLLTLG